MGSTQQFSLKWNKYRQNWDKYLLRILRSHLFSDVMVACDGEVFQLHRVVLASCSAYFEKTLQKIPAKETPIVMLSDITEAEMRTLIEFMYCGEATIDQTRLESLLKAAERLQIRGLAKADGESSSDEEAEPAASERRTEHREAAAAALQSRSRWPAERGAEAAPAGRPHWVAGATSGAVAGAGAASFVETRLGSQEQAGPPSPLPPPPPQTPPLADPLDISGLLSISVEAPASEPPPPPPPPPSAELPTELATAGPESSPLGLSKRNTSDSPHVRAALQKIADGEVTVAEASIQYDIPIPTLYLNMRRQGVKARGRLGMTGKRKPRAMSMSQEMRSALTEIQSGAITASKASRKYNITLPRIMSWMRKTGVKSAYARNQQGPPPEGGQAAAEPPAI